MLLYILHKMRSDFFKKSLPERSLPKVLFAIYGRLFRTLKKELSGSFSSE